MDLDLLERLQACSSFDWDDGNKNKNETKHGVTQGEAEGVFFNGPLVHASPSSSVSEQRFYALGETASKRELFVAFTIRGDKVRVISARPMSRKESTNYRAQLAASRQEPIEHTTRPQNQQTTRHRGKHKNKNP